jgi:hypothetical protein
MFLQVFQTLVLSVSFVLFCTLQLLHLNVSKVDQVLHMGCMQKAAGDAHNVWGGVDPLLVHSLARWASPSLFPC